MNSIEALKLELKKAASLSEPVERNVLIAAIIAEALRSVSQDPILVGGVAVEYYTQGGYSTADIDLVSAGGRDLVQVMESLGFEKIGKDFIQKTLKIYIEFPSRHLKASELSSKIRIGKKILRIISLEDLLVDRLCAFKFWQSAVDGLNSLLLLENSELDEDRLDARAKEEEVLDALHLLQELREEIIRKKIPPKKASLILEKQMKRLKP